MALDGSVPQAGEVLNGKYRIERVLGNGSLGPVLEAYHLSLSKRVAIKFLDPEFAKHRILVERFFREARAAASIRSEHIGRVLDLSTPKDGLLPYMVQELLSGADLAQIVQERGPLPIGEACDYIVQACDAIAEAHALGIVHRDLKAQNLFLTVRADGSPIIKVVEFGVSKWTPRADDTHMQLSITVPGTVLGSVASMAPEQIKDSRQVGPRADIWALGATLHELLTGSPPFSGESDAALCRAILLHPPKPLRKVRPDAPELLEWIILKCLQRDPEKRFATVVDLTTQLKPLASSGPPLQAPIDPEAQERPPPVDVGHVRHWEARPTTAYAPGSLRDTMTRGDTAAIEEPTLLRLPRSAIGNRWRLILATGFAFSLAMAATAVVRSRTDQHAAPDPAPVASPREEAATQPSTAAATATSSSPSDTPSAELTPSEATSSVAEPALSRQPVSRSPPSERPPARPGAAPKANVVGPGTLRDAPPPSPRAPDGRPHAPGSTQDDVLGTPD